ncbi:MAG: 2-C-methyl-D-erythritol 4-phosphate cytidylyltransferase [Coriobacteriia bacterium]
MTGSVIVAGGVGARFGAAGGKQLALLAGEPVLTRAVRAFERCGAVDRIVVVTHPGRVEEYRSVAIDPFGFKKVVAVVAGGERRQDSVLAGLSAMPEEAGIVAVHDGARPLVRPEVIAAAVETLRGDPSLAGAAVGMPARDTVHVVDSKSTIVRTPERGGLWQAQTPQVFRVEVLVHALEEALADGIEVTDDASAVARVGGRVVLVEGGSDNIKVTTPEDLVLAEALVRIRERERQGGGA